MLVAEVDALVDGLAHMDINSVLLVEHTEVLIVACYDRSVAILVE